MQEIEKKPEGDQAEKAPEVSTDNIAELKEQLAGEQEKARSYMANWQRATADLINYRKRAEQEKSEAGNLASSMLMSKILPVLDDLDRALACNPDEGISPGVLLDGVKNTQRKFLTVLESEGVSTIKSVGETFNPAVHEAVMEGEGEPGKVVAELRRGYRFKERVLRPALVIVGKEREEKKKEKEGKA